MVAVLIALLVPPAAAAGLRFLSPRAYGLGGICVVYTACAAGIAAGCAAHQLPAGVVAAAVSAAAPWVQWVPWWRRRRSVKRMARLGGAHEMLAAYERARRLRIG